MCYNKKQSILGVLLSFYDAHGSTLIQCLVLKSSVILHQNFLTDNPDIQATFFLSTEHAYMQLHIH